jgi:hypothetical protein
MNQDKDLYIVYNGNRKFTIAPVVHEGIYFGYNIYCGDIMLGTFDDASDAWNEVGRILECREPVYCVQEL